MTRELIRPGLGKCVLLSCFFSLNVIDVCLILLEEEEEEERVNVTVRL